MKRPPFIYRDFAEAKDRLTAALTEDEEPYTLLTGATGTGKSALLRLLQKQLDRSRYRILYFAEARKLGATGLIKVLGEALRARTALCHSVMLTRVLRALAEDSQRVMIWIDEAQDLPEETMAEVQALVESELDETSRIQVLFCGLPRLRNELQTRAHLWRRIMVREEITGLLTEELPAFLEHHFSDHHQRLCDEARPLLIHHAKGVPGFLIPMFRATLGATTTKGKIDVHHVEETLDRWDLA